ncbi:hypothetical protein AwWohl_09580 [Gammaproteobacteria bacterium]|nr:hypothetical protein AwWohl_09580 [Gammaproteobacteria bacterium]
MNSNEEKALIELESKKEKVEQKLKKFRKNISFQTREWSIESILEKFINPDDFDDEYSGELYIPDYQRKYKWNNKIASRFIESILIGFPIPYIFISNIESDDNEFDGRIEIIDGSQRIRALKYFINNKIILSDLKEVQELDGFTFNDLSIGVQRRFKRSTLRLVELLGDTESNESMRRDLFERINSGSVALNAMEQRRGTDYANSKFYKEVLVACVNNELFQKLAPLSDKKYEDKDREELVLRFFAYSEELDKYKGTVAPFLDSYLKSKKSINDDDILAKLLLKFTTMLEFVEKYFPSGFRKTPNSKVTYRTFFEAIAVGVTLALDNKPKLKPKNFVASWIFNDDFKKIIASDSANNTQKLKARIEYVKTKLLED